MHVVFFVQLAQKQLKRNIQQSQILGEAAKDRIKQFIITATAVLQLQSNWPVTRQIPNWHLSALEVDYDRRNEESKLQSGPCGMAMFRGTLRGEARTLILS